MIDLKNLTRKFGNLTAVQDLSLNINDGEVFGILGPNGAGKTTTIRMLCCLIKKTSGEAHIGEYSIDNKEDALKIRKVIGFLPENVGLYENLSAYANLDFYGKLYDIPENKRKENIEHLLKRLGLWERRHDGVGGFSKGMKQKIAIARALIHDPEVIFLDEPTANLDPEASKTVRDFILQLKQEERTIIINTHNLGEAERLCDRLAIVKNRLITVDSPINLKTRLYNRKTVVHLEQVTNEVLTTVNKLKVVKGVNQMGNKLLLELENPEKQNPEVVRSIVAVGGNIQYITELKSSLEDVYLKLINEVKAQ
jgi:ABC-type multidrug transport system, ATPase component